MKPGPKGTHKPRNQRPAHKRGRASHDNTAAKAYQGRHNTVFGFPVPVNPNAAKGFVKEKSHAV